MTTKFIPVVRREATTASGVIRQAMNILEEEGRWIQGAWAQGEEIDLQKPLCKQGWGACADGAVLIALQGLPIEERFGTCKVADKSDLKKGAPKAKRALYRKARQFLDLAAGQAELAKYPDKTVWEGAVWEGALFQGGRWVNRTRPYDAARDGDIISWNDFTTRDEVLEVFRKAYRHAQYIERLERAAAKAAA